MKREGNQHGGTVRSIPQSGPPNPTRPPSGSTGRVASKPSSHSKFADMGRLNHIWKSKDSKGAQKAIDFDLGCDEILVLRVTGKGRDRPFLEYRLKLRRYSAQGLLDELDTNNYDFDPYF